VSKVWTEAQEMTQSLIIPVGVPGCGKSTYGALHYPHAARVSSDEIREELGDVNDQTQNDRVFEIYHDRIRVNLELGLPHAQVYADATNLTVRARTNLLQIAMEVAPVNVHLVIFANADQAILRNARRDRVVPPEAMLRMLEQYEDFRLRLPGEQHSYKTVTEIRSFDARRI
jgi:predicted kinase